MSDVVLFAQAAAAAGGALPGEFFTRQSVLSLTAVVAMTTLVANGVQTVFNWNPRWFALALAELFCFVGLFQTNPHPQFIDMLLAVVNGFLVFAAAAGATSAASGGPPPKTPPPKKAPPPVESGQESIPIEEAPVPEPPTRKFFTPWFG